MDINIADEHPYKYSQFILIPVGTNSLRVALVESKWIKNYFK